MKGILIYDKEGKMRNKWFIDRLIANFNAKGVTLDLLIFDGGKLEIGEKPDFAIVRTIAPTVNYELESAGVKVFNNYLTSFTANSKWQTYLACVKLGVHVMPTVYCPDNYSAYPCVIKSCDGHGGTEVFKADGKDSFSQVARYLKSIGKDYVVQPMCSHVGVDVRVYVMGEKILAAVKRTGKDSFKSNFSLGGSAELFTPVKEQTEAIEKIVKYLDNGYIGVDFIFDNGRWVLNEIEDPVGARMLYSVSDIDVAKIYCEYIADKMKF